MNRTIHLPNLGATVTVGLPTPAACSVATSELQAARRTHAEMLRILDELTCATAGQPTLHRVLRSAQGMGHSVAARLAGMEG